VREWERVHRASNIACVLERVRRGMSVGIHGIVSFANAKRDTASSHIEAGKLNAGIP
jgi:hypothetical protein